MRKYYIFGFVCLLFISNVIAQETRTGIEQKETLVTERLKVSANLSDCKLDVGWTEWKPYQYLSSHGKVEGLQIELLKLIGKEIDCEFIFHQKSWKDSVKAVKEGQVDLVGNASINQKRSLFARFSISYRQDLVVLYIRSKEKESYGMSNLKQLMVDHRFRLGMVKDAVYDKQIESFQNSDTFKSQIYYVDRSEQLLSLLVDNKIDGYFEDPLIFDYSLKGSHYNAEVESYPIAIKMGSIHFMFSKKRTNEELVHRFDAALKKIKSKYAKKFDWFVQQ